MNDQFNFNKQFVVLQSDRKKASDCKKGGRRPSRPPLNPPLDLLIIKSIELLLLKNESFIEMLTNTSVLS